MINGLKAFAKAVSWGTLIGALPYTVLFILPLVGMGMGEGSISNITILLAFPFVLSGAFVLGSAVVFGLPLTAVLSGSKWDGRATFAAAGAVLGALVPTVIIWSMAGELGGEVLFFALPGAFAGHVAGTSWGRWREAQRAAQELD